MDKKINIRKRIIVTTFTSTLFFIFVTSPIFSYLKDFGTKPGQVENLSIDYFSNKINFEWDKHQELDIEEFTITAQDKETTVDASNNSATLELESTPNGLLEISFISKDFFGRVSEPLNIELDYSKAELGSDLLFNQESDSSVDTFIMYLKGIAVSIFIILMTIWIFSIKKKDFENVKLVNIVLYPALNVLPLLLLFLNFIQSEGSNLNELGVIFISLIGFYVLLYFLLLTTNILYNSIFYELPLEQAAKASQFIFSLISSYIVLILFLGKNYSLLEKIVLIAPFIFYFSFASIVMLKNISMANVVNRSLGIMLTVIYGVVVLSMWPINYIYIMLSIAIIFYILLSIALENKDRVGKYVIVEYSVLLILISLTLIINSSWGVLGNLL